MGNSRTNNNVKCRSRRTRKRDNSIERVTMDAGEVELIRLMIRDALGEVREAQSDLKMTLEELRSVSSTIRDAAALSAQAAVVATEAAEEMVDTSEELTEADTEAATEAAIEAAETSGEAAVGDESDNQMVEVEEPEIEPSRAHFLERPLFGGR